METQRTTTPGPKMNQELQQPSIQRKVTSNPKIVVNQTIRPFSASFFAVIRHGSGQFIGDLLIHI